LPIWWNLFIVLHFCSSFPSKPNQGLKPPLSYRNFFPKIYINTSNSLLWVCLLLLSMLSHWILSCMQKDLGWNGRRNCLFPRDYIELSTANTKSLHPTNHAVLSTFSTFTLLLNCWQCFAKRPKRSPR
jgi:hypothetical protein